MTHTLNDCGCTAKVYSDGSGVDIEFCSLHNAAPELLKALNTIKTVLAVGRNVGEDKEQAYQDAEEIADYAIAKAEATI